MFFFVSVCVEYQMSLSVSVERHTNLNKNLVYVAVTASILLNETATVVSNSERFFSSILLKHSRKFPFVSILDAGVRVVAKTSREKYAKNRFFSFFSVATEI